ncbi:MAG: pyruvate formate lyase family protein [Lentisphaeria bacterium]
MSDRITRLRNRVLTAETPPGWNARTFSWPRTAAAADYCWRHCETGIYPGELIVGFNGRVDPAGLATFQDPVPEFETAPRPAPLDAFLQQGFLIPCGNHQVANYQKVLSGGLRGVMAEIDGRLAARPAGAEAGGAREFLLAMRTLAAAMIHYCHRYAAVARHDMTRCDQPGRRQELAVIAATCDRVIERPAETFWEACQALYFTFLLVPDSPGRIDQYLFPYYQRDLAAGRITKEFAEELLSCLWIKYFEYWGKDHLRSGVTHLALGGLTATGECAVNELSYLCLDVAEKLALIRPQIAIRWNRQTPGRFVRRGVELLRKNFGSPNFCSDEQIVPALVRIGIAPADAWDYCPSGCHEIMIPGKSQMGALMGEFNLPKTLGCVLGIETLPGGPVTELAGLRDWEQLWAAWRRVMARVVAVIHEFSCFEDARRAQGTWWFTGSLLTDGCIESARGLAQGGAVYNYCNWDAIGVANLADALLVIKKQVFEDQAMSLAELAECLRHNWQGFETLRERLDHQLPRFGNDHAEVDGIAAAILREVAGMLEQHTPYRGGRYTLGTLAGYENAHAEFGLRTGATLDGRRAGEPFAASLGPVAGRDRNGLTAMLNSVAALPHELLPTSTVVNVTLDPGWLATADGAANATALIIAHFLSGGQQLQFTVADGQLLRNAQNDPARYDSLMVRVAGYSARFTSLDRNVQDEILARTTNHQ